MLYVGHSEILH